MKRFQSRATGGQWRRNTLANTFGLQVVVCSACRRMNPYAVTEDRPVACCGCGASPIVDVTANEPTRDTSTKGEQHG